MWICTILLLLQKCEKMCIFHTGMYTHLKDRNECWKFANNNKNKAAK